MIGGMFDLKVEVRVLSHNSCGIVIFTSFRVRGAYIAMVSMTIIFQGRCRCLSNRNLSAGWRGGWRSLRRERSRKRFKGGEYRKECHVV